MPKHGTTQGYNHWACRCSDCREAWAAYMRAYRKRRQANAGRALGRKRKVA